MGLKSGGFFWEIVNKQLKIVNKQLKTEKNPPLLKHILALPMVGQICTFEELQPFEIATFDLGHPVCNGVEVMENYQTSFSSNQYREKFFSETADFTEFLQQEWSQ